MWTVGGFQGWIKGGSGLGGAIAPGRKLKGATVCQLIFFQNIIITYTF